MQRCVYSWTDKLFCTPATVDNGFPKLLATQPFYKIKVVYCILKFTSTDVQVILKGNFYNHIKWLVHPKMFVNFVIFQSPETCLDAIREPMKWK